MRMLSVRSWIVLSLLVVAVTSSARADFTFGEPVNLGPPMNTSSNEGTFFLTADGLEMYVSSNRSGTYGIGDIWVSNRGTIDDNWTEPVNLGPIVNSPFPDTVEYVSPDGLELYFDSLNRPGGLGGWDIWVTKRATVSDPWTEPINLGAPFNTSNDDWRACIRPDNLKFYFVSTRPGGYGGADIWAAQRPTTEDAWAEPVNVGPLINSPTDDSGPCISSDGLAFFFQSMRSGGYGGHDLWVTVRRTPDDDWNVPVNLGPTVNTSSDEILPEVSTDRSTLYFCSPRAGGQGAWDVYRASIVPIVDFNGDELVDINDLLMLIDRWGQDDPQCDIAPFAWGDGVVDRQDLEVLMGYWGQEIPSSASIAWWKFNEECGSVAADSVGDHHGTLVGDPVWRPTDGRIGGALELDGVDDCVSTPFVVDPGAGAFSVFAWVKGGGPGQVILYQNRGSNWLMADASDGTLATDLKGGRGAKPLKSSVNITDGQWHRVGLTWDGSHRTLYVDDIQVAGDTQAGLPSATDGLTLGSNGLSPATFWAGLLDDVRIYDRAVEP
jgi:hypothetical protein